MRTLESLTGAEAPAPAAAPAAPVTDSFTALGVVFALSDVSYELARRSHSNTSFSPEIRARQEQERYLSAMRVAADAFEKAALQFPDRKGRAADMLSEYRTGYLARLNGYLSAHAGCASWFITGPSRFPTRQQEKRWATTDRRSEELHHYATVRLARMVKLVTRPPRQTAAERAEDYRRRVASAEAAQEMMKEANKILRDKKLPAKLEALGLSVTDALVALGFREKVALEIQQPDYLKRVGFPAYALSNNKSEIARLKKMQAIEEGKARQAQSGPVTREYDTEAEGQVTYEEHPDDNRVRLIFPGKPQDATRALLKSNGFRWSPSNGAWQRFLTGNGKWAAEHVLRALKAQEAQAIDFQALAGELREQQAVAGGQG